MRLGCGRRGHGHGSEEDIWIDVGERVSDREISDEESLRDDMGEEGFGWVLLRKINY